MALYIRMREKTVNEFISSLTEKGLELTREESFEENLGITYEQKGNEIICSQTGLIKKILNALDLVRNVWALIQMGSL